MRVTVVWGDFEGWGRRLAGVGGAEREVRQDLSGHLESFAERAQVFAV